MLIFVTTWVEDICAEPARIGKIRFLGNDVTQEETMLLEMTVHEGDVINIHDIEQSVQYIMDLGIFEKVSYYLEKNDFDEDTDLVIVVTEPYYWYVLPTFKFNDNSELELGARLRWDNLFGYNHRLLIKATDKGTDKNVNEYQTEIRYTFPRFLLSRYSLSLIAKKEQRLDDDNALGNQQEIKTDLGFNVRKWLNKQSISRGLYAGFGIDYQKQSNVALNPLNQSEGDFDLIFYNFQLGRDRKYKYRFNRGGDSLDYTLQLSSEVTKQMLTYRSFNILNVDDVTNLNYLISVGYADDDVLGNAAFALGGNSTLRGYEKDAFHGNVIARGSVEYLTKFNNSPLVRKVIFVDAGDT